MKTRPDGRPLLVGHRGAAALAPENTLVAIGCAVEAGVDLVELDVLELIDGSLVLAHSDDLEEISHGRVRGRIAGRRLGELRTLAPDLATLDDALALLAERAPEVGAHLDLKSPGIERGVVAALRRHRAVDRAVVSSCDAQSLRVVADLEPNVAGALTYPCDRFGLGHRRSLAPARALALRALRMTLPGRIGDLLARAGAAVASLHWSVVTPAAVESAHRCGAAVLAWTVNDEATARRLVESGVDGVITDDPVALRDTLTP